MILYCLSHTEYMLKYTLIIAHDICASFTFIIAANVCDIILL